MLDGHLVEEDGEDALLHLSGIFCAEDDHFLISKVNCDGRSRGHALGVSVGWERPGIVDGIIGVEMLEIFRVRADEHVAHEKGMIGSGADHPNLDPIFLVPSRKTIHYVDSISGVEIIDSTLAINSPDLNHHTVSIAIVSNLAEIQRHVLRPAKRNCRGYDIMAAAWSVPRAPEFMPQSRKRAEQERQKSLDTIEGETHDVALYQESHMVEEGELTRSELDFADAGCSASQERGKLNQNDG